MFRVSRIRYLTQNEKKRPFEEVDNCEWLKPIVFTLHTGHPTP
jgi:hypothetical protein